ncbi:MAG: hypothetical protein MJA84_14790 [Firmicutes bacterium]|nr:hypothetical protein [Bacillota bacterium]
MKIAVEIYAEKLQNIKDGSYIKTALKTSGGILPGSEGCDRYGFASIITSTKRVAGLGREFFYNLSSFPAGMGAIEARPGRYLEVEKIPEDIALEIETNFTLDPGMLADSLGLRLVSERGGSFDIPLCRPDIPVFWDSRGKYTIPLNGLLQSNLIQAVS